MSWTNHNPSYLYFAICRSASTLWSLVPGTKVAVLRLVDVPAKRTGKRCRFSAAITRSIIYKVCNHAGAIVIWPLCSTAQESSKARRFPRARTLLLVKVLTWAVYPPEFRRHHVYIDTVLPLFCSRSFPLLPLFSAVTWHAIFARKWR